MAAFQSVVDSFNASSTTRQVTLKSWPDHESALEDVLAGNAPDAFLTSRIDLGQLVEAEALQPVSLLLDERGVDFGDRFSRDAVDAFAMDDELQCMAYSVSPMVIYYNTELVDFDKMERRELDVPTADDEGVRDRWTLAEFGAAATVRLAARRPARGLDRPDPAGAGAVHLLRRRPGLRRRPRAHVAGLLRRQHPRGARARRSRSCATRRITPTNAQLARATPRAAVQARRARDDRRLPQPRAGAARRRGPRLRRAPDADHRQPRDRRRHQRPVHLRRLRGDRRRGRLHRLRRLRRRDRDRRLDRLHRPGQHRRSPPPRTFLAPGREPAHSGGLQREHPLHGRAAVHRPAATSSIEAVTPLLERLVTAPGRPRPRR